jgi:transketolase
MRDTFSRALYQVAKADPRICIVVADISPAGSMAQYRQEFPERFMNVGVAEQAMIGICAGLAMRGMKPFAYTIATFTIYRPFEQIRVDLCYQNLPVTVVGIGGGVAYSVLGGTHHAQEDIAVMSALPNMSILAPCDPLEVEAATWHCAKHNGPLYLRMGKAGEPVLTANAPDPFEFGKARLIKPGNGTCILSYGVITKMAFDLAAKIEKEQGGQIAVYSVHTVKPLDREGISKILRRYDRVIVLEEHSPMAGLGPQVKALAWESGAKCKLHTFSLRDEFVHFYGGHGDLLKAHGLHPDLIYPKIIS